MSVQSGRWVRALAVVIVIGVAAGAVWLLVPHPGGGSSEMRAEVEGGPLHVSGGDQGFALTAPAATPYVATFGSMNMCSTTDSSVEISKVTLKETVRPQSTSYWIRVTRAIPIGAGLGSPPTFSEEYAGQKPEGDFEKLKPGFEINRRCDPKSKVVPLGQELMVSMHVGGMGAYVGPLKVHYRSNGRKYVRTINYAMIACGRAEVLRDRCQS